MATSEGYSALQSATPLVPYREGLSVHSFAPGDAEAWDRFVQLHPGGSFFHQIGWKRTMEKTYDYQPYYFYSKRESQITGIAPSFLVSNWLTGRYLLSLPFAVYGGICANDPESEQALTARLEQIATDHQVEYLELRSRKKELLPGFQAISRYATFTIPLVKDIETLYRGFPKDIRYMIRKGEKAGLRLARGTDRLEHFYRLMTINLRRLGTPAFPRVLFKNLLAEFPGQVDLTLLYSNDHPVAGAMSFFFRGSVQPYYIGSTDNAKTLAANNLLWWELIKMAAASGCSTFDFGRSKINSGNFDFKKKWNPTIESLEYQVRLITGKDIPHHSPANPKFNLATTMWKKMPLFLTRVIGPHLVRLFP
jgi:FemAB-related protein (PEP-CTERM system-associated)